MKFKIGDLVRVKETTDDARIPENRSGLLVGNGTSKSDRGVTSFTSIWRVLMTNGATLKFHEMFLEKIGEQEDEKES